jgi:hypothetical protein
VFVFLQVFWIKRGKRRYRIGEKAVKKLVAASGLESLTYGL